MTNPLNIAFLLFQAVVLGFTLLSVGITFNRARVHLTWLLPLMVGQMLALTVGLANLFMIGYMMAHHVPFSQMSWLFIPQQIGSGLSLLANLWFAVALFLTLRSHVFSSSQSIPPQVPGSWPPPPSV